MSAIIGNSIKYSVSAETAEGEVSPDKLHAQLEATDLSAAFIGLTVGVSFANDLMVEFAGVPTGGDKVTVDAVVLAHEGVTAPRDGVVAAIAAALSEEFVNYKQAVANVAAVSSVAGVAIYNCLVANEFRTLMTENISNIEVINPPAVGKAQAIRVVFVQDAAPRTLPGGWVGVDWWIPVAGAPVMPAGAEKNLIVTIYSNGHESIGTWVAEP